MLQRPGCPVLTRLPSCTALLRALGCNRGVVSALVSPEGACYFLTLNFSLPDSPERRLGRHWPFSPSTVVLGAQNVYFLIFTQEGTIVTRQKGNGGTGRGSDSAGSSWVTHTALRRNLDPDCVKTEEGPSNHLSYFLCSLVLPPPQQQNAALSQALWLPEKQVLTASGPFTLI